jgi:allantoin racemase
MIRIWHQSMTTLEELPGYARLMQAHAQRVCDPATVVDLHGLREGTHAPGVAPIQAAGLAWLHELNSLQIVENVIRAGDEGYDAVAMSCFGDPKLDVCRSLVDIPVLSAFETSLLVASTSGRAFGFLVPTESAVRNTRRRIAHYGYEHRSVAVVACDPPVTEYDLATAFDGNGALVERLVAQMRQMVAAGVDIVIPAEGVLNAVLVHNEISNVDGAPVLDSYGAVIAMAEMLARLQRATGLRNSRKGMYSRPDRALVEHARSVAVEAFLEATARSSAQ